ncbi:heat shock protein 100 (clp protein) [Angomonas deanei]|nr:heat shock protein 100 (clp protein) [Angomonas deanei]|eukprot:EPY39792.1 heat shock protein 100 (clp protein) [Angomonas deanei]
MQEVKQFFRPEFINRLDDIVLFRSLGMGEMSGIIELIIAELNQRLREQQVRVQLTDEAKQFVLESAFDAEMGARPLRRWVEKHITTEISRLLISQDVPPNSTVRISVPPGSDKITLTVKRGSPSSSTPRV